MIKKDERGNIVYQSCKNGYCIWRDFNDKNQITYFSDTLGRSIRYLYIGAYIIEIEKYKNNVSWVVRDKAQLVRYVKTHDIERIREYSKVNIGMSIFTLEKGRHRFFALRKWFYLLCKKLQGDKIVYCIEQAKFTDLI